ncbi:uncharacterized [Tachysurus ichikawai]
MTASCLVVFSCFMNAETPRWTKWGGGRWRRVTCSTWRLPQLSANQLPQGMQLLKLIGRPDPEAEGCRCDDRSRKGKKGRVEGC